MEQPPSKAIKTNPPTRNNIQVTQQVPGRNSRSNVSLFPSPFLFILSATNPPSPQAGAKTDFPLTASIPAAQTCTGTVAGQDNVCLVRCMNGARAGPFGGVVPVQMAAGAAAGAAAGNSTVAAAGTGKTNARRALARRVRATSMRVESMRKRAETLAREVGDADVLAEIMEDCE